MPDPERSANYELIKIRLNLVIALSGANCGQMTRVFTQRLIWLMFPDYAVQVSLMRWLNFAFPVSLVEMAR